MASNLIRGSLTTGDMFYEPQVSERDGMFWMTITLSRRGYPSRWTSQPARLHVATREEALGEAARQTLALKDCLEG